jgi:pimeloyl-ACP methyl ester carboxylesterase
VGAPLASVEALADWLLALLDAAGIASASLVGHSMGSLIALEAAARAPGRVRHLVMVGTAYPMKVSPALLDAARTDPLAAIDSVNTFSHATLAAKPGYPGPGAWLHGGDRALMRRMQAAQRESSLFVSDFAACDRYRGGLSGAARVACPVTFVLGTRDQMTQPSQAGELAAALRARVVTLPCGHALMSEAPDGVLGAVRAAIAIA